MVYGIDENGKNKTEVMSKQSTQNQLNGINALLPKSFSFNTNVMSDTGGIANLNIPDFNENCVVIGYILYPGIVGETGPHYAFYNDTAEDSGIKAVEYYNGETYNVRVVANEGGLPADYDCHIFYVKAD